MAMALAKKLMIPGVAAIVGLAGGSLVSALSASAATSGSSGTTQTAAASDSSTDADSHSPNGARQPIGPHNANGITETALTGDDLTKATAAAQAAESGATVVRAETDAEGSAYEVHMKKSDGSMVTLKLDSSFKVTSTENGR
jgi:hypothetical protein